MLQGTRFQDQVLKPCKSIQKTSEEVLYFKTRKLVSIEVSKAAETQCRQLLDRQDIYRGL